MGGVLFFFFFFLLLAFLDSLFLSDLILPAQKCLMCGSVLGHSNGYRDMTCQEEVVVALIQKVALPFESGFNKSFYCSPLGGKRSSNV